MSSPFCTFPLYEAAPKLIDTAMGRAPAELVIRRAALVNVCTGEILPDTDVAVSAGRIALVGNAAHCIGADTRVIDADGAFLAPGFLDGHIHVESSMLSVGEFARAVVPHGTVGIYMDPHEICNVLGMDGVRCMIEDSRRTPLKTMVTAPSCVPGMPGFEDNGADISAADIAEMMRWPEVVGLGEMMNYPGVLAGNERPLSIIRETQLAGKPVTGHYPDSDMRGLNAYIAAGISSCHESTRAEDALAKMRLGMYAMIREGSAWHDLAEGARAVTQNDIDSRFAILATDDAHPNTLLTHGHMDYLLRRAVQEGISPVQAIQMATINTATCFGMQNDLGSIAPGKCADMVLLGSLEAMDVRLVLINGEPVAENGRLLHDMPRYEYPARARTTMNIGGKLTPDSFRIPAPERRESAGVRCIGIIPANTVSREMTVTLPVSNGCVDSAPERDILKAVVFERHNATGRRGFGFVSGFGITGGAMASTVSHDAHNLLVVGTNDGDMALAANTLIESGGGMCVVRGGQVLGLVRLPIAGLMSGRTAQEMALEVASLEDAWCAIGCTLPSPFMTMALIPLACIPELRLTDRGLVDCRSYRSTDLFTE